MSEPQDKSKPTCSTEPLQVAIEADGDMTVVKVSGMAASEVTGQLSRMLQEAANTKRKRLAVDLSELSFVSSAGLGGFVAAHVTCGKHGTTLVLVNPQPFIRDILEVTRLSTLFTIVDSLEQAKQV